jgi:hypothetical protein
MNRILRYVFATVCLLACGLLIPGQTTPNGNSANSGAAGDSARSRAAQSMLHLPLRFEESADGSAMVSRSAGREVRVEEGGAVTFAAVSGKAQTELRMSLAGSRAKAEVTGGHLLPTRMNYIQGSNPAGWRPGVAQFGQARVNDIYPGINLVYYGNGEELEHDYELSAGADASAIRMQFRSGVQTIDATGDLILRLDAAGPELLRMRKPVAFQRLGTDRVVVHADYTRNADGTYGFALGQYDHSQPLTIDPTVIYGTYFGGSNSDNIVSMQLDSTGNIYLLLQTESIDLKTVGSRNSLCSGTCGVDNPNPGVSQPASYDFFIAKLDPTGSNLLIGTYLGGSASDVPVSIGLEGSGAIYVYGSTESADFPLINPYQATLPPDVAPSSGVYSGVLAKLSADGSTLLYSTFFGHGSLSYGAAGGYPAPDQLALAGNGVVYITGNTDSPYGDSFASAKNAQFPGGVDFVAKFDTKLSGGSSLLYATPIGGSRSSGSSTVYVGSIALDSGKNLWIYGTTTTANFPVPTAHAVQSTCGYPAQCSTTYLLELDPSGQTTKYASYFGGTTNAGGGPGYDYAVDLVVDAQDNMYVGGRTENIDYPVLNPAHTYSDVGANGFVTAFGAGGYPVLYSTYVARTPSSLAVFSGSSNYGARVATVTNESSQNGQPPFKNAISTQGAYGYTTDAYFGLYDVTLSGSDSVILESYLGANNSYTTPNKILFDPAGNLLIAGSSAASNLPVVDPFQVTCDQCGPYVPDGFLTRISMTQVSPTAISLPNTTIGSYSLASAAFTNFYPSPVAPSFSIDDPTQFLVSESCIGYGRQQAANCTVYVQFQPTKTGLLTATVTINDNEGNPPLTLSLSGTGIRPGFATFNPVTQDFSSSYPGYVDVERITITNTGGEPLATANLKITGPDAADFALAQNCGGSIAVGNYCVVGITFTPVAGQFTYTAALTLNNGSSGTQSAALTATIANAQQLIASPTSLTFPTTAIGSTSTAQQITLTSSGTASVYFIANTFQGNAVGNYTITANNCSSPLAVGASCSMSVAFTPTSGGQDNGSLYINSSGATRAGTPTIQLTGNTGNLSKASVTPAALTFPATVAGTSSAAQPLTLTNTGTGTLNIASIALSGANGSAFGQSNNCSATLPASAFCTINVVFSPASGGVNDVASLVITDDSGGVSGSVQSVSLTGSATTPTVTATLTPPTQDFGSLPVGTTSPAGQRTFTLTNTGTATLTNTVTITGTNASSFVLLNNCTGSLAANGGSCSISILFHPQATGSLTATLNVSSASSAATVTESSALTGTGLTGPTLTVTPNPVSFAATSINTSAAMSVTLTNTGNGQLTLNGTTLGTLGGADAAYFSFTGGSCGYAGLAAGSSCTASVTFTPNAARTFNATLTIPSNDSNSPAIIALLGSGGGTPQATFGPAMANFGNVALGTTSAAQNFTLANTGSAPLTISNYALALPTQFVISSNACQSPLAAGASCILAIAFAPTNAGPASGTLTVTDNTGGTAGMTQSVSFTGTGVQPTATLTPATYDFGRLSVTGSASSVLILTNTGSIALTIAGVQLGDTVNYSKTTTCSASLAVGASCTITVTFNPQTTGTFTIPLTVTSGAGIETTQLTGVGLGLSATLTPASSDFGVQAVNYPTTNTFTLTNTSTVGLSVGSITIDDTRDYSVTNVCPASLAVNASCSIALTFNPQTTGPLNTTLRASLTSGTQSTAASASITGHGATIVNTTLNPSSYNFQTVVTGTSQQATFTLTNSDSGTLYGLHAIISGSASMQITGGSCGTSLSAGASCTYIVTFSPTAAGAAAAFMNIDSNTFILAIPQLNGTGILPRVTLTPQNNEIGIVALGSSATATATLTNPNAFAITGISATFTELAPNSGLSLSGGTCGTMLAANASCTYVVTFAPTIATGASAQQASLTVSAANAGTVNATFTGVNGGLTGTFTPASYDFGSVTLNDPVTHAFTLTNTSPIAVSVSLSGSSVATAGGNAIFLYDVSACGTTLAVNASCTVYESFTPASSGSENGEINATLQAGLQSLYLSLSVTGTGVTTIPVTLSPSSYNFQTVTTGTSQSTTFTLTNNSSGTLSGLQGAAFGDASLQITGGTCSATLAASASCTYVVTFSPTVAGPVSGSIDIASNLYSLSAPINGTGILPRLTLLPASYNFSNVIFGTTATTTATLTNPNAFDVTGLNASFTGPFFQGLALTGTTCGSTLGAGASCTYTVSFTPIPPTGGLPVAPDAHLMVTGTNGASGTTTFTGQGALPTLTFSPATYDFGNVVYGVSATTTVTLSNPNPVSVSGISSTFQDLNVFAGSLSLSGTTCGTTLAANASCTYTVSYTAGPATAGFPDSTSGTLTVISSNANVATATFKAAGVPPPLTLSPATYSFGNVLFGASATTTMTLTNPNSASITGLSATFMGSNSSGMSLSGSTCGATLAANATCSYTIAYTPNTLSLGFDSGTLTVSASNGSSASATFTGSGVQPALTLSPATYNFGSVALGSSATTTITVSNANPVSVTLTYALVNDVSRLGMSVTGGSCANNIILAANTTCTYIVTYAPTGDSSGTAPLVISYGGILNGSTIVSSLSGQGVTLTLALSQPTPFGSVNVGSSALTTLTLSNTSSIAALIAGVTLSGSTAFSQTNNCPAMLAANSSCTIKVALNTSTIGSFSATLAVMDNATAGPQTASLTATVVGVPQAVFTPAALNFGAVNVGSSASQTVTISNPGTGPLTFSGVTFSSPQLFTYANNGCGGTLAPGASCTETITFTPTGIASVAATETVGDNAGTQTVSLIGSGLQAIAVVTPTSLAFPNTVAGISSAAQTVQLANTGNLPVALTSVSLSSNPAFVIVPNMGGSPTCGTSLAAGASCYVSVSFQPQTTGSFTAILAFMITNGTGTQMVPLQGTGVVPAGTPDFTLRYIGDLVNPGPSTNAPPTQLGDEGQFTFSLQVSSVSNSLPFTGTVVVSASGPEAGTTFTVTPASVVPGTQTQTVSIAGQVPKTAMARSYPPPLPGRDTGAIALAALVGLFTRLRRRHRLRMVRLLLCLICLLPLALTLTGCPFDAAYALPGGSGIVTVTATSGTVVHSIQVTVQDPQ